MLISLFYRQDCLKSRFLRLVLREMDWELDEFDVEDPESAKKLVLFKEKMGSGSKPIHPAIYSTEAYSHELFCILEYLHERNPGKSMYPNAPTLRLSLRTILHRVIRAGVPAWDHHLTGDSTELLALYGDTEQLMEAIVRSPQTYRSNPETPTFLEVLFALLAHEVHRSKPIENKTIRRWLKEMAERDSFSALIPEFERTT